MQVTTLQWNIKILYLFCRGGKTKIRGDVTEWAKAGRFVACSLVFSPHCHSTPDAIQAACCDSHAQRGCPEGTQCRWHRSTAALLGGSPWTPITTQEPHKVTSSDTEHNPCNKLHKYHVNWPILLYWDLGQQDRGGISLPQEAGKDCLSLSSNQDKTSPASNPNVRYVPCNGSRESPSAGPGVQQHYSASPPRQGPLEHLHVETAANTARPCRGLTEISSNKLANAERDLCPSLPEKGV